MSEQDPIKQRVVRSSKWVIGGYFLSQVLRLGSNLLLSRILFPEAFGLMAIVYVLMAGLSLMSDLGINQSIVQNKRGGDSDFLNTAWVVQICRGVLISLVILLIAYFLPLMKEMEFIQPESVYADSMLPSILAVISFVALIQGFESTKMALAQRKVQLKKMTKIELLSQVIALCVMIIWAMFDPSVWVLVAGTLVAATVRCIASHVWMEGPSNSFKWDVGCFKEIFHFGKWLFLSSILTFLWMNGDRLMLGGMLNASLLGVYSIAFLLSNTIRTLCSSVVSRVVFPALSEVVLHHPENLNRIYQRFHGMANMVLFGAAGFLFVAADEIVSILYDVRYIQAGEMLAVLSLGLIGMRYIIVEYLWLSRGHIRYLITSLMLRTIFLYAAVPYGFEWGGLTGALYCVVLSGFASWPIAIFYKVRHGLIDWFKEVSFWFFLPIGASFGWLFQQAIVMMLR